MFARPGAAVSRSGLGSGLQAVLPSAADPVGGVVLSVCLRHAPVPVDESAGTISCRMLGYCKQHLLNFFPLPHEHGSLRPTFSRRGDACVFGWIRSVSSHGDHPAGRVV
jgi:hypothetical protein